MTDRITARIAAGNVSLNAGTRSTRAIRQTTIRAMEEHPAAERHSPGYVVALIGVLGFVVGCFLPYAEVGAPAEHSLSLYRLITMRVAALAAASSHLYLFAGAATIALISLAAVKKPRAWAFPALAAASIVWALTWIGILLGGYGF